VNTACRLESLTKEFPLPIALTAEVYERVAPESRSRLAYIRDCELKGKSEACPVYGLTVA